MTLRELVTDGSQATCDPSGASLPSIAATGNNTAILTWYQTSIANRTDPIQSCAAATAAPLLAATVNVGANSATIGTPVTLTTQSTSIRPAATLLVGSEVVVAAPNASGVGIWTLDATGKPGPPVSIPGLAGAKAVSIATDGAGNFAVVAEIGCSPQSIVLAIGTFAGGFSKTTTIVQKGSQSAVQPTVAWVASQSSWIVSWIATPPAKALAMRLDSSGNPQGGVIDPSTAGDGACATADGRLLAYVPGAASFVTASLGCAE